jgi:uncharacterized protein
MTPRDRRAVTFPNRQGQRLFGILHEPPVRRRDAAVVLLSAGIKGRVGPHRLYNALADALVEDGLPVLRFDFAGLGDSEGRIEEYLLTDYYGSVSLGRYVDDTIAAVEWTCRELGVPRVILAGLCGGAITGLLAAPQDARVAGVFALGLPIPVDGSTVDKVNVMSRGQLEDIRGKYLRKLLDPAAWMRLLTLKTDFRLLRRSLSTTRGRRTPAARPAGPAGTTIAEAPPPGDNTNPHFAPRLGALLERRCPVFLLFSESDRLYAEFLEKFVERTGFEAQAWSGVLDIAIVKEANHVLTFGDWQRDMLSQLARWTDGHFPCVAPADGVGVRR